MMHKSRRYTIPMAVVISMVVLATMGLLAPAAAAGKAPRITDVRMQSTADSIIITIQGDAPLAPQVREMATAPRTIVVTIPASIDTGAMHKWAVKESGILSVRSAQFTADPLVVRIVASVAANLRHTMQRADGDKQIIFTVYRRGCAPIADTPTHAKPSPIPPPKVPSDPADIAPAVANPLDASGNTEPDEMTAGWVGEIIATAASINEHKAIDLTGMAKQKAEDPTEIAGVPAIPIATVPVIIAAPGDETLDEALSGPSGAPSKPKNANEVNVDLPTPPPDDQTVQGFKPTIAGSAARISVEFVETEISDVLAGISMQTGMNVVTSPEVKGKITLRMTDADPTQVLQMASAMAGFHCEKVGDTYLVGTQDGIDAVKLGGNSVLRMTKVLPAYYEHPDDIAKMLTEHMKGLTATVSSLSTGGADTGTGDKKNAGASALIVSGTPAQIAEVETMLGELSAIPATNRQGQEIEVYEAKYADPVDLIRVLSETVPDVRAISGPVSGFKAGGTGSAQKSSFQAPGGGGGDQGGNSGMSAMPGGNSGAPAPASGGSATKGETTGAQSNRLLLMGSRQTIDQALAVLKTADVPEKQVMVHVQIADINETNSKKLGTLFDWASETWAEMTMESKGEALPSVAVIGKDITSRILHRTPFQITATLEALYQNGDAKVLADPRVSVLNNRPATFFVGDKILYPVIAGVSSGTVLYTIESEEVGIGIDVLPQVGPDGTITMAIHPFINAITQWIKTPQGDYPQTSKREAQTTIRLRDGETVAIGGLMSENEVKNISKLPFIGDLPFLGELFKHRSSSKTRSEVVVLITCTIVDDLPLADGKPGK